MAIWRKYTKTAWRIVCERLGSTSSSSNSLEVRDENGTLLGDYFADLFVESGLIIELKACRTLTNDHVAQVLGYLRASGKRHALLINFGASKLEIRKFVL